MMSRFNALTSKHWILLILTLLFFNIMCYGCALLLMSARG